MFSVYIERPFYTYKISRNNYFQPVLSFGQFLFLFVPEETKEKRKSN